MYFEIKSKRTIIDSKGNDKEIVESFIVDKCELFAEAEQKGLEQYNGENDIIAIKQSRIREFANSRTNDEQSIFLATIEDTFVNEDGSEKVTRYIVGFFADSIEEATKMSIEYMKQGLNDMALVKIQKTKFVDII